MATVSHYAMRRYPIGPVDDTNQLAPGQYYVASGPPVSPMYDKSKKTWSQRLKITKVDKPSSVLSDISSDYSQSALSRSMKYAEPWLYGTVRGIPARPVRGQAIFAPLPAEVAVVVCSCPEYLNGTKKEVKKASICKKCKGSRLPLAPIGGTVCIRSTTAPIMHKARGSAGTVRLPSSSIKIRPTILDPLNDPYDLMRRSRLLSPEPKPVKVSDKTLRNRAKSTSPNRGRSRSRLKSPVQIEDPMGTLRSRSASRSKQECWLDTHQPDPGGRRSILRCDVNPYDLISSSQYNNEFAPNQDDLFDTLQITATVNRNSTSGKGTVRGNRYTVQEIAGQRISLGESSGQGMSSSGNSSVNYDHIDSMVNQSDDFKQKQIMKQSQLSKQNDVIKNRKSPESDSSSKSETSSQPKRPPRRKHEATLTDDDANKGETSRKLSGNATSSTPPATDNPPNQSKPPLNHASTEPSLSQKNAIKSILKRPSSLASSISSSSENEVKVVDMRNEPNSIRKTSNEKGPTPSNKGVEIKGSDRTGSQFYLPIPQQRKKVQFMVADEIIRDEDDVHQSDETMINDASSSEYIVNPNPKQERILDMIQQEQQRQQHHVKSQPTRRSPESATASASLVAVGSESSTSQGTPEPLVCLVTTPSVEDTVISQEKSTNEDVTLGNVTDELALQTDKVRTSSSTTSLRRTNSERCANTTTIILNFNDTMALRVKNNRVDSRSVFFDDEKQQHPISIDKKQQKKCLSSTSSTTTTATSTATTTTTMVNATQSEAASTATLLDLKSPTLPASPALPTSENLQQDTKGLSRKWGETPSPNGSLLSAYPDKSEVHVRKDNNLQMEGLGSIQDQKDNEQDLGVGVEVANHQHRQHQKRDNETGEQQQNLQLNKKISWQENGIVMIKNEPYNSSLCSDKKDIGNIDSHQWERTMTLEDHLKRDKLLQAQKEIYNGTRIFGNQGKYAQKTVVRVAPFNKTSPEIHRLKIRHDDGSGSGSSGSDSVGQKKTSILINGDDCYSTVNVSNDTPIYQSSVVVTDGTSNVPIDSMKATLNTVTINVRTPEEEIIYKNNKINNLLNLNAMKSVIPISGPLHGNQEVRNGELTTPATSSLKRGRTLITLDYGDDMSKTPSNKDDDGLMFHEEELVKILRNPVEAVKRNLVPHVCGKLEDNDVKAENCSISKSDNSKSNEPEDDNDDDDDEDVSLRAESDTETVVSVKANDRNTFLGKLLEDPTLSQLADGLEGEVVAKLVENSLKRLKKNRCSLDTSGTKDNDGMTKLIDMTLNRVKEERLKIEKEAKKKPTEETDVQSNRGSISSVNSYGSASYDLFDFDNNESDCYQSCSSEMTGDDDTTSTRSKFYQMLVDATLSEIEISNNTEDDHHYESIRLNGDPIYEEISEVPPPLPLSPPPLNDLEVEKKNTRSMFEGASKYDILSYLVDAKERGIVREESYEYNFSNTSEIIVEEEIDTLGDLNKKQINDISSRISHLSTASDSSEDTSLPSSLNIDSSKLICQRKPTSDIERNDSGVGSETSKTSRSKYQNPSSGSVLNKNSPIHLCEDCDGPVETQVTDSGVMYAPLVCRKCGKKRAERKEIITEIVETEEKYGRDLQIVLEEFCQPMLVAGLLTQEQLSAIFLNTEELLENNQALAERMRDALDIAMEQGDDDLLTVNVGKLFLEATPMLHAFESYCVRQAAASLLLANLEKEKELLRIFLKVSQMENSVLRRMNLNSFLMVPVQRVTKYPLLLARLYKVTPPHLEGRELLKQAQEKIELHLNHINQEAKDVPTKLWRRISSSSPNRRASCEIDMINIKLRKMAIDVLEWNHDEVRFAMEGKLLFTQPTDSNWKKGRTIKLTPVNALLVTNGKPSVNYKVEKALSEQLNFPKHTGIREASLLLVKEKCGRYTLIREPLYLDRCVVCTEADWDDYFEVQEISSKDTFIFKAEDGVRTKQWYAQLQYHAQGMGAWRKRRNALANIMINGMLSRT